MRAGHSEAKESKEYNVPEGDGSECSGSRNVHAARCGVITEPGSLLSDYPAGSSPEEDLSEAFVPSLFVCDESEDDRNGDGDAGGDSLGPDW
jgi:hypothetical protein